MLDLAAVSTWVSPEAARLRRSADLLGKVPDGDLAERCRVPKSLVGKMRRALGIAKCAVVKTSARIHVDAILACYRAAVPPDQQRLTRRITGSQVSQYLIRASWQALKPHVGQFGVATDERLSELSGLSRQTVMRLRRAMGVLPTVREALVDSYQLLATQRRHLENRMRAGDTLLSLGATTKVPMQIVRSVARGIDWNRSWVINTWSKRRRRYDYQGYSIDDIISWQKAGETLEKMALKVKLTRERVRQLLLRAGCEPAACRRARERSLRLGKKEAHRRQMQKAAAQKHRLRDHLLKKIECLWLLKYDIDAIGDLTGVGRNRIWYEVSRERALPRANQRFHFPFRSTTGGITKAQASARFRARKKALTARRQRMEAKRCHVFDQQPEIAR